MGIEAAIIGGIMGATSLAGSAMGSSAANKAASTQASATSDAAKLEYKASQEALALQEKMFNQEQANLQPWLTAGQGGLQALTQGLGIGNLQYGTTTAEDPYAAQRTQLMQGIQETQLRLNELAQNGQYSQNSPEVASLFSQLANLNTQIQSLPAAPKASTGWTLAPGDTTAPGYGDLMKSFSAEDFTKDPGYDFRLGQGAETVNRYFAGKAMPFGGSAAKALTEYGQGFASNEYQNAYNRFNQDQTNRYNRLAALAGLGQTTAANLGATGSNYANAASNTITGSAAAQGDYLTQAANARASGYMGGANAWAGGLSGGANSILNAYMLNKILKG